MTQESQRHRDTNEPMGPGLGEVASGAARDFAHRSKGLFSKASERLTELRDQARAQEPWTPGKRTLTGAAGTTRTMNAGTGTLEFINLGAPYIPSIAAGDKNLQLVADNMTIGGAITGTGLLYFAPHTSGRAIGLADLSPHRAPAAQPAGVGGADRGRRVRPAGAVCASQ